MMFLGAVKYLFILDFALHVSDFFFEALVFLSNERQLGLVALADWRFSVVGRVLQSEFHLDLGSKLLDF